MPGVGRGSPIHATGNSSAETWTWILSRAARIIPVSSSALVLPFQHGFHQFQRPFCVGIVSRLKESDEFGQVGIRDGEFLRRKAKEFTGLYVQPFRDLADGL